MSEGKHELAAIESEMKGLKAEVAELKFLIHQLADVVRQAGPFSRLTAPELSGLAGTLANCFVLPEPTGPMQTKKLESMLGQVFMFHPTLARHKDDVDFRNFVFELARGMGGYFRYQVLE